MFLHGTDDGFFNCCGVWSHFQDSLPDSLFPQKNSQVMDKQHKKLSNMSDFCYVITCIKLHWAAFPA
jgi:hypothetical protein